MAGAFGIACPRCSRRSIEVPRRTGLSLVEVLVAMVVVGLILALVVPLVLSNRRAVELDQVRTSVNQTLRAAHDLIAADIRIAGERFNEIGLGILSPIELELGADGSVLVLRRALEAWLPVCDEPVASGATAITVALDGVIEPQRCVVQRTIESDGVDWPPSVLAWRTFLASVGGQGAAYVHDRVSGVGQYFLAEVEADTDRWLVRCLASGLGCDWDATYSDSRDGIIGLLEVFEYRVDADGVLVRRNAVTGDELRIADGVARFEVAITAADGSVSSAFASDGNWSRIRSVDVTIGVVLEQAGTLIDREMTVAYFPRNVLSR